MIKNIIVVFSSVLVLGTTHAPQVTVRPMSGDAIGVFELHEGNLYLKLFERIDALAGKQWPMPKVGKVTNKITFLLGAKQLPEHVRIEDIPDLHGAEITIIPKYSEQRLILPFMQDSNWTIVLCGNLLDIRIDSRNGEHTLSEHLKDRTKGFGDRAPRKRQDAKNFATLFLWQSDSNPNQPGTGVLDKDISCNLKEIVLIHKGPIGFVEYTLFKPTHDGIKIIDDDGNEAIVSVQDSALNALQSIYNALKANPDIKIEQELLEQRGTQAWKLKSEDHVSNALFHGILLTQG